MVEKWRQSVSHTRLDSREESRAGPGCRGEGNREQERRKRPTATHTFLRRTCSRRCLERTDS